MSIHLPKDFPINIGLMDRFVQVLYNGVANASTTFTYLALYVQQHTMIVRFCLHTAYCNHPNTDANFMNILDTQKSSPMPPKNKQW